MATAPAAKIQTGDAPMRYFRIGATGTTNSRPIEIQCDRPKLAVRELALSIDVLPGNENERGIARRVIAETRRLPSTASTASLGPR